MPRLSLRVHIFSLLAAIMVVALAGGAVVLWYAHKADSLISDVLDRDFRAYDIAEKLAGALLEQRGLATYYFLDGDPEWLTRLDQSRVVFESLLDKARVSAADPEALRLVGDIEARYLRYTQARDYVLDLYRSGRRTEGAALHGQARGQFAGIHQLCLDYRDLHERRMQLAGYESRQRMTAVSGAALAFMPVALTLAGVLAYVLVRHVLRPIRRLAEEVDLSARDNPGLDNEIKALGRRVQDLLEDVGSAKDKLQKSRAHLLQAEKWALTGKLAAGVAHSIRNPLTSVKIRLFSLGRSLRLTDEQKEDFEVITEEIGHIDAIARNFLDFSRPPKLRKQIVPATDVVDSALTLMRHRLESYCVEVNLRSPSGLRPINADPEQLKEVLVNLMVNACEAMTGGGRIDITVEQGYVAPMGNVVVIRVADTGPGIAAGLQDTVFQPFYSSKEEGTGLGLAIARRIVEEHGGWITAKTRESGGAQFSITLPCQEDGKWHRS